MGAVVIMRYNENALKVIERVKAKLADVESGLCPGVKNAIWAVEASPDIPLRSGAAGCECPKGSQQTADGVRKPDGLDPTRSLVSRRSHCLRMPTKPYDNVCNLTISDKDKLPVYQESTAYLAADGQGVTGSAKRLSCEGVS